MAKLTLDELRDALGRGTHVKPSDTDAADVERLVWAELALVARKNARGEIVYVSKNRFDSRLQDLSEPERREHFKTREAEWKQAHAEKERMADEEAGRRANLPPYRMPPRWNTRLT